MLGGKKDHLPLPLSSNFLEGNGVGDWPPLMGLRNVWGHMGSVCPLSFRCGQKHSCCLRWLLVRSKHPAIGHIDISPSSFLKEQGKSLIRGDEGGVLFRKEGDCNLSVPDGKNGSCPTFYSNPSWPSHVQHPSSQQLQAGIVLGVALETRPGARKGWEQSSGAQE